MHRIFIISIVIAVALLQASAEAQYSESHPDARADTSLNQLPALNQLYDEVIRLMREYYVEEIDETTLYDQSMKELLFVLPPECIEKLTSNRQVSRDPAIQLRNMIKNIASSCGAKLDRLVVFSLNSVLSKLDANSSVLDADTMKEIKIGTSGKFGGIGMIVEPKNNQYTVTGVFAGTPAYRAGVSVGDIILEIDGMKLEGLQLMDVLKKVRGPAGSSIYLNLQSSKENAQKQVKLQRQVIKIAPVRDFLLNDNVGYIRIVNFQETVFKETVNSVNSLWKKSHGNLQALIIDLRDNPGGLFGEAIQVANFLIGSGRITSIRGKNSKLNKNFDADQTSRFPEIPIVVLINKGSASAAEVLAGSLQGRPNVSVLGQPSYGKASVQAVFPLKNGTALRITTAHYYTADGRNIEGKGLQPDILINSDLENKADLFRDEEMRSDPWISKALSLIKNPEIPPTLFETLY